LIIWGENPGLQIGDSGTLGSFGWDYRKQAEFVVKKYDFKTLKAKGSFDIYENVDCFVYLNLHNKLKFYKHGYSKVTDQLCREIRHGRLSRSSAEIIERAYNNKWNDYEEIFCRWLGITEESLDKIISNHKKYNCTEVTLTKKEYKIVSDFELSYMHNDMKLSDINDTDYILFGKGI
jgi:hypothetical protein